MDSRNKQLEQDLSALGNVVSQLGARLSEAAKDATASGMLPSEKLIEQIQAARANFDSVRVAVHAQAASMMVSPLPKAGELMSIASVSGLLKAAAAAEESRSSSEGERERALAILARVMSIHHREASDFKPLQECKSKVDDLRIAITAVSWPNRHPELDAILKLKHPSSALLNFVENLDTLEDDKWMALESTISVAYGKPLFVAASRGKLLAQPDSGAAAKPVPAADQTEEKKILVEKPAAPPAPPVAPPAASPVEKKLATPPTPFVAMVEKKEVAPEPVGQKPLPPAPPAPPAPLVTTPVPVAPAAVAEKKETPNPVLAGAAPVPPAAVAHVTTPPPSIAPLPAPPQAAVHPTPVVAETPSVAPVPPRPPAPIPAVTHPAAPIAAQTDPATVTAGPTPTPSLSALANATEPGADRKLAGAPPVDADKLRKEPRLATTSAPPPPAAKVDSKPQDQEPANEELQKAMAGDGSQRPQRWGFWRGNR